MLTVTLLEPGRFAASAEPEPTVTAGQAPGQALVAVRRIGICGTDLHAFTGRQPFFNYPRILGHELGVEILSIPENDLGLAVGDLCSVEPYLYCGECPTCQAGRTNCCETLQCMGVHCDGGMRERIVVPITHLYPSKTLSLDQLALVETLGIGEHAVKRAGVQMWEPCLVVGAGPIGLATAQFAQLAGGKVTILDTNPSRRELAQRFGFETVAETDKLFDVVFDATGNKAAMESSVNRTAFGGAVVFVGLVNDSLTIHDPTIHRRELTILASRNSNGAFPSIISLIESGRIDTSPWITHRLKLSEVPERFASLSKEPGLLKAMIEV
ncbi:MAG: zinc-binding alcohol dehydrogenase family protein [Gemmataceae bacterium]